MSDGKKDIQYDNIYIPVNGYLNFINNKDSDKVKYLVIHAPYGARGEKQKQIKINAAVHGMVDWMGSEILDAVKNKEKIKIYGTLSFTGIKQFKDTPELHGNLINVESIYINNGEVYKKEKAA